MKRILLIFWFVSFIVLIIGLNYQHEIVHKEIFRHYGLKSEIDIKNLISMQTIPENKTMPYDRYVMMTNLHLENEIITYNIYYIILSIYMFGVLFIITSNPKGGL